MATRKTLWTPEVVRERIKTTQLIKRLYDHVIDPEATKMSRTQIAAATFLISRVIPIAEAPKNVHVTGQIALSDLITQAAQVTVEPPAETAH